ncbi:MAG: hypothetical protein RL272_992 [Candidatus Parcubacteria bacterium]|jgi:muramoyltetrapeptide carboxypeptidase LdcA involved in peptidoglycan recycling
MAEITPRKLAAESAVRLVYLSSAVEGKDRRDYDGAVAYLRSAFRRVDVFDVVREAGDPWYLSASPEQRLRRLREAIPGADWICPAYGGTGCADVVRRLGDADLKAWASRRPVVTGFSDSVFLINYLYFAAGLRTFHAMNGAGLSPDGATRTLFAVLRGERDRLAYRETDSRWITPPPVRPIEGTAIGGNLTTFRDLVDIAEACPEDWSPYVLFLEDLDVDAEDVHRMLVSLEAHGVFAGIRGLVVGRMDTPRCGRAWRRLKAAFGGPDDDPRIFLSYVLKDALAERERRGDPLPILRIERFGHEVAGGPMIVPIGARTVIAEDRTIEFVGPFVA